MTSAQRNDCDGLLQILNEVGAELEFLPGLELPAAILLLDLVRQPNQSMLCFRANPPRLANLSPQTALRLIDLLDTEGLVTVKPLGVGVSYVSLNQTGRVLASDLKQVLARGCA